MMKTRLIISVIVCVAWLNSAGCTSHTPRAGSDTRRQLAERYGIEGFDQVEVIRFTFNAQVGAKHVRRAWLWKPPKGEVTYRADNQALAITFIHPLSADITDTELRGVDAQFVNDRYWLLFPLQMVWDKSAVVEERGWAPRPMGTGQARRIEVRYPSTGGYTPGDVYALFIEDDGKIGEWVYHRGGYATPTRISTWEKHRRLGPLMVSLEHRGPDGFRVWFSDVSLKLVDREGWLYPEV